MSRMNLREMVEQLTRETDAANAAISGVPSTTLDLFGSANFQALVNILTEEPLLVVPCLRWLQTKRAEMSRAQLATLYTPEELEALYAGMKD